MPERHEHTPPETKLGRISGEALELIKNHPEGEGLRVVVFLEDDANCMTALGGWEKDVDAIAAVFAHLAAIFEANGKKLMIMPLGRG